MKAARFMLLCIHGTPFFLLRGRCDLRLRSCLLLCSLRLNARLQYWHLYFFSGALAALFGDPLVEATSVAILLENNFRVVPLTNYQSFPGQPPACCSTNIGNEIDASAVLMLAPSG